MVTPVRQMKSGMKHTRSTLILKVNDISILREWSLTLCQFQLNRYEITSWQMSHIYATKATSVQTSVVEPPNFISLS